MNAYFNQLFIEHVWPYYEANAKVAASTKKIVQANLGLLTNLCQKDPLSITHQDAELFLNKMIELSTSGEKRKYTRAYVASLISKYKSFYRFLYDNREYFLENYEIKIINPFAEIVYKYDWRTSYTLEDIPSFEELDKLLTYCDQVEPAIGLSIRLSIKLGLTTTENCELKKKDLININEKMILHLKENEKIKSRDILIPTDLTEKINEYIGKYNSNEKNEYLLINEFVRGNGISSGPFNPRTLQRHLKICADKANIGKEITFSDLRNFFIYHAKEGGAEDEAISEFIGVEGNWVRRFIIDGDSKIGLCAEYMNFYFK